MIVSFVFAGAGVILLVLLVMLLRREPQADAHLVRAALGADLLDRLPPREVLNRIFDASDLDFLAGEGSRGLLRLLVAERRTLALHWLCQIRREAFAILAHHRRAVRYHAALRPGQEIRIILHAITFFAIHLVVSTLVAFYGAFHTHAVIHRLFRFCDYMARLRGEMLADVGLQQAPALN